MREETGHSQKSLHTYTLIKSKSSGLLFCFVFLQWLLTFSTALLSSPPSDILLPSLLAHSGFLPRSGPWNITHFADYEAQSVRPVARRSGR